MFAKRLKELRCSHDLTQKDIADFLGITPKTISFYELGQRMPPPESLSKLALKFNVSVDYLLGLTDIPDKIDNISAKNSASSDTDIELTDSEREMIEQFRQLSDRDKGKIEGRIEEMLKDDYKSDIKGA